MSDDDKYVIRNSEKYLPKIYDFIIFFFHYTGCFCWSVQVKIVWVGDWKNNDSMIKLIPLGLSCSLLKNYSLNL